MRSTSISGARKRRTTSRTLPVCTGLTPIGTIAGADQPGYSGNTGGAASAALRGPQGAALGGASNLCSRVSRSARGQQRCTCRNSAPTTPWRRPVSCIGLLPYSAVHWPRHLGELGRQALRTLCILVGGREARDDRMIWLIAQILFTLPNVEAECSDSAGVQAVRAERFLEATQPSPEIGSGLNANRQAVLISGAMEDESVRSDPFALLVEPVLVHECPENDLRARKRSEQHESVVPPQAS